MVAIAFDAHFRRASLLALGAAGMTAALTGPLSADAKNTAKKKLKKKQRQRCQAQVAQCDAVYTAECEKSSEHPDELQECLDMYLPCCASLGTCGFNAFYTCLLSQF